MAPLGVQQQQQLEEGTFLFAVKTTQTDTVVAEFWLRIKRKTLAKTFEETWSRQTDIHMRNSPGSMLFQKNSNLVNMRYSAFCHRLPCAQYLLFSCNFICRMRRATSLWSLLRLAGQEEDPGQSLQFHCHNDISNIGIFT